MSTWGGASRRFQGRLLAQAAAALAARREWCLKDGSLQPSRGGSLPSFPVLPGSTRPSSTTKAFCFAPLPLPTNGGLELAEQPGSRSRTSAGSWTYSSLEVTSVYLRRLEGQRNRVGADSPHAATMMRAALRRSGSTDSQPGCPYLHSAHTRERRVHGRLPIPARKRRPPMSRRAPPSVRNCRHTSGLLRVHVLSVTSAKPRLSAYPRLSEAQHRIRQIPSRQPRSLDPQAPIDILDLHADGVRFQGRAAQRVLQGGRRGPR